MKKNLLFLLSMVLVMQLFAQEAGTCFHCHACTSQAILKARDTVPGKVTFSIKASPLALREQVFIVNGVVTEKENCPPPANIETAQVLKSEKLFPGVTACAPRRDAVIITTKPGQQAIRITDRISGQPVPNASVTLLFIQKNKPGEVIVADSAGYISVNDHLLNQIVSAHITSVGYRESILPGEQLRGEFKMERKWDTLHGIAIVASNTIRCGSNRTKCYTTISKCSMPPVKETQIHIVQKIPLPQLPAASVFPNPVKRGSSVQVKFTTNNNMRVHISFVSLSGQTLFQTDHESYKGSNQLSIPIPRQMAAGVYLLLAKNETGRLIFQQRVVAE